MAKTEDLQDQAALIQPSVRSYIDWTPQRIRSAERLADAGSIRLAALLVDELLADDKIQGSIQARTDSLLGLTVQFDDGSKKSSATSALEASDDWWLMFPEEQQSEVLQWGVMFGFAPSLLRWRDEPDHGARKIPRVDFWHPSSFEYSWQSRLWTTASGESGARVQTDFGLGQWWAFTPYGSHRPWAKGLWRGLALWWLLKQFARLDWARHGETGATTYVKAPLESNLELRKELARQLKEAGRNAKVVLPPGFDIAMVEVRANTEQIYRAQIDAADKAIGIAILGGNLTSDVGNGSLAAAQVHDKVEARKTRFDGQRLSTSIHDQVLSHWAEFNFGNANMAPWPKWPTDPPEDQKTTADMMVAVGGSLQSFVAQGFGIDQEKLIERFGLDFLEPGEKPEPAPVVAPPPLAVPSDELEPEPKEEKAGIYQTREVPDTTHDGQEYTDRLGANLTPKGADGLARTVAAMVTIVRGSKSYGEAYQRIIERYRDIAPPRELAAHTEAALILAQLAGQLEASEEN